MALDVTLEELQEAIGEFKEVAEVLKETEESGEELSQKWKDRYQAARRAVRLKIDRIYAFLDELRGLLRDSKQRARAISTVGQNRELISTYKWWIDRDKDSPTYDLLQAGYREFLAAYRDARDAVVESEEEAEGSADRPKALGYPYPEPSESRLKRFARREEEKSLGLAKRGKGMCQDYLDHLSSLKPKELLAALSTPNVFGCTEKGVQMWLEERKRREEQAQEELRRMREQMEEEAARGFAAMEQMRMTCHPWPAWVIERIEDNPQPAVGSVGPHTPVPLPFTPDEIRNAVVAVLAAARRSGGLARGNFGLIAMGLEDVRPACAQDVSAADVRIAERFSQFLQRSHSGRGWIKVAGERARGIVSGGYLPDAIEKVFGNPRGLLYSDQSPERQAAFDLENFNTTYMNQLRLQRMPAWLREYGRPTFTPPEQRQPTEAEQIAMLERHLRQLRQQRQLPAEDGPGGEESPRLRDLRRQIEEELAALAPPASAAPPPLPRLPGQPVRPVLLPGDPYPAYEYPGWPGRPIR